MLTLSLWWALSLAPLQEKAPAFAELSSAMQYDFIQSFLPVIVLKESLLPEQQARLQDWQSLRQSQKQNSNGAIRHLVHVFSADQIARNAFEEIRQKIAASQLKILEPIYNEISKNTSDFNEVMTKIILMKSQLKNLWERPVFAAATPFGGLEGYDLKRWLQLQLGNQGEAPFLQKLIRFKIGDPNRILTQVEYEQYLDLLGWSKDPLLREAQFAQYLQLGNLGHGLTKEEWFDATSKFTKDYPTKKTFSPALKEVLWELYDYLNNHRPQLPELNPLKQNFANNLTTGILFLKKELESTDDLPIESYSVPELLLATDQGVRNKLGLEEYLPLRSAEEKCLDQLDASEALKLKPETQQFLLARLFPAFTLKQSLALLEGRLGDLTGEEHFEILNILMIDPESYSKMIIKIQGGSPQAWKEISAELLKQAQNILWKIKSPEAPVLNLLQGGEVPWTLDERKSFDESLSSQDSLSIIQHLERFFAPSEDFWNHEKSRFKHEWTRRKRLAPLDKKLKELENQFHLATTDEQKEEIQNAAKRLVEESFPEGVPLTDPSSPAVMAASFLVGAKDAPFLSALGLGSGTFLVTRFISGRILFWIVASDTGLRVWTARASDVKAPSFFQTDFNQGFSSPIGRITIQSAQSAFLNTASIFNPDSPMERLAGFYGIGQLSTELIGFSLGAKLTEPLFRLQHLSRLHRASLLENKILETTKEISNINVKLRDLQARLDRLNTLSTEVTSPQSLQSLHQLRVSLEKQIAELKSGLPTKHGQLHQGLLKIIHFAKPEWILKAEWTPSSVFRWMKLRNPISLAEKKLLLEKLTIEQNKLLAAESSARSLGKNPKTDPLLKAEKLWDEWDQSLHQMLQDWDGLGRGIIKAPSFEASVMNAANKWKQLQQELSTNARPPLAPLSTWSQRWSSWHQKYSPYGKFDSAFYQKLSTWEADRLLRLTNEKRIFQMLIEKESSNLSPTAIDALNKLLVE